MNFPCPRRQLLVAVGSFSLAGCLVESDTHASDSSEESTPSHTQSSTVSTSQSTEPAQPDSTSAGNATSLETAGIAVETIRISRIIESPNQSQLIADIVIANPGTTRYGTLELRADAYYEPPADDRTYHPPRVSERTAVGRTYIERTYDSFDSGTRTLSAIVIQYDDDDANGSTDPDEFDIKVAVRRAEPV